MSGVLETTPDPSIDVDRRETAPRGSYDRRRPLVSAYFSGPFCPMLGPGYLLPTTTNCQKIRGIDISQVYSGFPEMHFILWKAI
jgi:hypothetical protein